MPKANAVRILSAMTLRSTALLVTLLLCFATPLTRAAPQVLEGRFETTFQTKGRKAVSMDFETVKLAIAIDRDATKTHGESRIQFRASEQGYPYFLLDAPIDSATLDGHAVALETVRDPSDYNQFWLVPEQLDSGSSHLLVVNYSVKPERVSYNSAGVGFITSMSDLIIGGYLERYAPANYEFDQYPLTLSLKLKGVTAHHELFANGKIATDGMNAWTVEFPSYFTSSSFFFHVTDRPFTIIHSTYAGLEKSIPITVYSEDAALAKEASAKLPEYFAELESTYGPFFHASYTAFIKPGRGGMEHCGATVSALGALSHELTHSWFARGVMPAYGSSGWIDEAIASWRDYGYLRAEPGVERPNTMLANFRAFERFTPRNCYVDGRALLADLDQLFSTTHYGGLRPVLAELFALWKGKTITTPIFQSFLEDRAQASLGPYFDCYVFSFYTHRAEKDDSFHPLPPTEDEMRGIR